MALMQCEYENIKKGMKPGDVIAFSGNHPFSAVIKLVTSSHVSHVGIIVPSDCLKDGDADEHPVVAEAIKEGINFCSLGKRVNDNSVEKLWWLPLDPDFSNKVNKNLESFRQYVCKYRRIPYDYLQVAMLGLMLLEPTLDSINSDLYQEIYQFILNTLNPESGSEDRKRRERIFRFLIEISNRLSDDNNNLAVFRGVISSLLQNDTPEELLQKLNNEEDFENLFCSEFATGALRAGGVISDVNPSEVTPIELCRFNLYKRDYTQFKGEEETRIRGFNSVDLSRWVE